MSKRGLSAADKKTRMLEIFHETAEFYTLKELEKVAPKTKGIVQQSVKDVLQDLCDDGLVQFDKIGTSNCQLSTYRIGADRLDFWSFPSAASAAKQGALEKAQRELENVEDKIGETASALKSAEKGREDTAERRKLLSRLVEVQAESAKLNAELAAFGAADPVKYERKARAVEVAKEAAYRWTDNTMVVLQYIQACGAEVEPIRASMGISELSPPAKASSADESADEWEDLKG